MKNSRQFPAGCDHLYILFQESPSKALEIRVEAGIADIDAALVVDHSIAFCDQGRH